jgi:outer membrane protein TolC
MTCIATRSLFLLLIPLAPVGAQAEILSLNQCVSLALEENPDITSANLEIDAANAKKSGALGSFGPRLRVEAGLQHWDTKVALPILAGLGDACTNCTWSLDPNTQKPMIYTPAELRARDTWSLSATLAQPLASLWTIREANVLASLGVDISKLQREQSRRTLEFQVIEAYFRLLQAKRMAEVAIKSVEQISAQVKRAQTFYTRGLVARNDVLRAELGLASAEQRRIATQGAILLARGRLATLIGRAPESTIDVQDTVGEPDMLPALPALQAEATAVEKRLELKEIAIRIDQANTGVRLAQSKMLPQVNAVANYTRGSKSLFQPSDAWFIGATASWDVWEGGSTYYGIQESKARYAQALTARRKVEDMIRLDARSAHVGLTTAAEGLVVAKQAVAQAEENFRIEQSRYENASNTSFDVLDAETQLTTANGQYQSVIYDYLIAKSNLARATGETLLSQKVAQ